MEQHGKAACGNDPPTLNHLDACWLAAALPCPASKAPSSFSPGPEDTSEVGNSASSSHSVEGVSCLP